MSNRIQPHFQNGHIFERIYTFEFYDESIHYKFDDLIKQISTYPEWAYIKHYKETKEPHYHCVIRFSDSKQINVLSEELGVPENHIKWRNNFRESMKYLTHECKSCEKDVSDGKKFIYPISDIITNLDYQTLVKIYGNSNKESLDNECQDVLSLLDYMESDKCTSIRNLIRYACKNKQWSALRRGGAFLRDAFAEVQAEKTKNNFESHFDERFQARMRLKYEEKQTENNNDIPVGFTVDNTIPF